jgi:hypothetical protein
MNSLDSAQRVLRLRLLPGRIGSPQEAAEVLSTALGVAPDHLIIYSLAKTHDVWEIPVSKVATLQLTRAPECMRQNPEGPQWEIPLPDVPGGNLILDTHFEGWTVLNDVDPWKHRIEYVNPKMSWRSSS